MTRCKVGDLVVMTRSIAGNEGKLMTVVAPYLGKNKWWPLGEPRWVVDRELMTQFGEVVNHVADSQLRPIRPGDMSDETPTEVIRKVTA